MASVDPSSSSVDACDDVNVESVKAILPPAFLLEELPLSEKAKKCISTARTAVKAVLDGSNDRVIVIVGPCSIHDTNAARDYADRLFGMKEKLQDDLIIIMRVYFEKPRTTVGWKGLINDPDMDGSNKINDGLRHARGLMCYINGIGLPIGCEFLDTITPQFLADTVAWGAIGARTTESQVHRELASGLSCPIGFKNGTAGSIQIAVDAIRCCSAPHTFPGVTKQGLACIVRTKGNAHCHVILRGADSGPNYSSEHVAKTVAGLEKHKLAPRVMIDVSHSNSQKKHDLQPVVLEDVCFQIRSGSRSIVGVMIESNIHAGNQPLAPGKTNPKELKYGVSVTDACVSWETTCAMLTNMAEAVRARRALNLKE